MDKMKSWTIPLWILAVAVIVFFLVAAKRILIPLVLAVAIWYVIESLAIGIRSIRFRGRSTRKIPRWIAIVFASVLVIGTFLGGVQIVVENFQDMARSTPKYEEQLTDLLSLVGDFLGIEGMAEVADIVAELDMPALIRPLVDTVANLFASVILVIIYVIFLLLERNTFKTKLRRLFSDQGNYDNFAGVMSQVNDSIRTYITVKIFTSFLTGLLSYIVMELFGLEFALFWAFLIFLLNFIPSLGSITATSLPLLFSLVQFEAFSTFFLLLVLLVGIQILVGNYIDPMLMGSRLNISPLVIILSLVTWGSIWGFAGMIFSVPIMAVLIISFAQFPQTRPFAVLLSAKGEVEVKTLGNSEELNKE
ncbi:MAG: AI-2E family transporter [Saprospirales bacterium]|nr:MAG: AI-2E family transporter [Saprospirales bacterium]